VFEATFVIGNYVAKPDILLRDGKGWRVIEVKSSLADTKQLDELIDDLTYTVMVLNPNRRKSTFKYASEVGCDKYIVAKSFILVPNILIDGSGELTVSFNSSSLSAFVFRLFRSRMSRSVLWT